MLYIGVGFVVGDGSDVRFWMDGWVGKGPLCGIFPRLFRLTVNKESSISEYVEVRGGSTFWNVHPRRSLRPSEGILYGELLNLLSNVFLCSNSKDSRIWKLSALESSQRNLSTRLW